MSTDKRFAVLIDADNISPKYIKVVLDEVSKEGIATYKRIYGDWTNPALVSWKVTLLDNSVIPIQQYSYTSGKNATDSAIIIDAMDILYSGNVEGFCLVSSDSDYTRLAARLRESGMTVVGMGEQKTPKPFITACSLFKYLDILYAAERSADRKSDLPERSDSINGKKQDKAAEESRMNMKTLRRALRTIVDENSDEDGWMSMSTLANLLIKRYPDFDVRNYGFSKLTQLIESCDLFLVKKSRTAEDKQNYVKLI